MFWLYSGNVSPINNHYYLSESRRSFERMLIFFLSCRCIPMFHARFLITKTIFFFFLSKFSLLGLRPEKREWGSDFRPPVSQLVLNGFETKLSIFRKWFICWSVSKPCSQWSLEFIKAEARVQEDWRGGLEAAVQKEETHSDLSCSIA